MLQGWMLNEVKGNKTNSLSNMNSFVVICTSSLNIPFLPIPLQKWWTSPILLLRPLGGAPWAATASPSVDSGRSWYLGPAPGKGGNPPRAAMRGKGHASIQRLQASCVLSCCRRFHNGCSDPSPSQAGAEAGRLPRPRMGPPTAPRSCLNS